MNTTNALIFLVIGAALGCLPVLFPAFFPPTPSAANSELWLQLMGGVQASLGGGFLFRWRLVPLVHQALLWRPAPREVVVATAEILRPNLNLGADPMAGPVRVGVRDVA